MEGGEERGREGAYLFVFKIIQKEVLTDEVLLHLFCILSLLQCLFKQKALLQRCFSRYLKKYK